MSECVRVRACRTSVTALAVGLGAVLGVPQASGVSGSATVVGVTITNNSVKFSRPFVPIGVVVFHVRNRTRGTREFTIVGRRTPKIVAGATATLRVTLKARRGYAYAVAPRSGPGTTGYFNAVAPCARPSSTTVEVTLTTNSIKLSEPSLQCGTVTFVVTNTDPSYDHDFSLDLSLLGGTGHDILGSRLAPNQTTTQRVSFPLRGNIYYFSSQPQDSENGLAGYLKVR